jgi:NitT/TauT family transport system substrate-binding protein
MPALCRAGCPARLDPLSRGHIKAAGLGQSAVAFAKSAELPTTMNRVRKFSFAHGLLGNGAASADAVGIQDPDGRVLGDPNNVKLRFDTEYMALAADGAL